MIIGGKLYIKSYVINSDRVPLSFDGIKLVFISDLHGKEYGENNKTLIDMIDEVKPDYILIGGDMVIAGKHTSYSVSQNSIKISIRLISELSKRYEIFHALGNHEEKLNQNLYKNYITELSRISVKLLDNSAFTLKKNNEEIKIYGLSLGLEFYPKFRKCSLPLEVINNKIGEKSDSFSILLAHSPTYFSTYAEWGAELILSGHLHGGIMRLPYIGGLIGPDFFLFPRYSGGIYEKDDSRMIVSCGAGTHTINLRVFNPPEITLIEFHRS